MSSTLIRSRLPRIPYVFATFLSCLNAWHAGDQYDDSVYSDRSPNISCRADRTGERYFHIAGSYGLVFFGYVLAVSTMSVPGRYIAMFLMTGGASGTSWYASHLTPSSMLNLAFRLYAHICVGGHVGPASAREALCCHCHRQCYREHRYLVSLIMSYMLSSAYQYSLDR